METILVKIFAVALALSQVTTTPDAVKTRFDQLDVVLEELKQKEEGDDSDA